MYDFNNKTLQHAAACLVALSATLLAVNAEAQLMVSLGGEEKAVTDDGFDFLSEDPFLSGGHLAAEVRVIPGVYAGLEYNWAGDTLEPFSGTELALDLRGFTAVGRYEYPVTGYFAPYVRGGLGLYYASLELDLTSGGATQAREQQLWLPTAFGTGGLQFTVPKTWVRKFFGIDHDAPAAGFTVGLQMELGYAWTKNAEFDGLARPEPDKEPDPEDAPLDAASIGFGAVSLSGPVSRASLVVRY